MVVKVNSAPASPSSPSNDPLRGVNASSSSIVRAKETEVEFSRLKRLVPAISKKQSVSKLDVILEAIRYIDQLQDQLVEQIGSGNAKVTSSLIAAAARQHQGKENAGGDIFSLKKSTTLGGGGRIRHKSQ